MHVVHVQCICTKPSCHLLLQAFYPSKLHQDFCPSKQAAHVNCKERENSPPSLASSNASSASPLQALLYTCDLSAHCRHIIHSGFTAHWFILLSLSQRRLLLLESGLDFHFRKRANVPSALLWHTSQTLRSFSIYVCRVPHSNEFTSNDSPIPVELWSRLLLNSWKCA